MSTLGEIELLSEILNASENPEDGSGTHCPSPAVLWALVEDPPAGQAGLISSLREHVAHCTRCAELARRFQGFVNLPETAGVRESSRAAEAAWAAAAPRLNRHIGKMLGNLRGPGRAGKETVCFWKRSWLPSFQLNRLNVAWAGAGFAMVAIITVASITYYGRQEAESGIMQSETAQAPSVNAEIPATGSAARQVQPVPPPSTVEMPAATSIGSRSDGGMPAPAISTASSTESGLPTGSLLFSSGARARIAILFAQREPTGGYLVQGELTPFSPPAGQGTQTAAFSALVTGHTGQERLSIRSFTMNGRQFELQGGIPAGISVSWPQETDGLAAGQILEVQLVSGALLRGVASSK